MGDQYIVLIIFACVAAFLGYRLWLLLGRPPGAEPPQIQRPPMRQPPREAPRQPLQGPVAGKVIGLADRLRASAPSRPVTPLQAGFDAIRAADPSFTPERFIDGARHAFEIIVKAFAEGDTATLRPLVSDEVYDTFAAVIRHRLSARETVDTRIERLQEPEIEEAHLDGRTAFITIKFVSGQVTVTRDAESKILEGDPERAVEHTDHWTFSRNTRSSDPNWILVGTGPAA
jgi:predicted lipid-binding transport protein (Tim44 family)